MDVGRYNIKAYLNGELVAEYKGRWGQSEGKVSHWFSRSLKSRIPPVHHDTVTALELEATQ